MLTLENQKELENDIVSILQPKQVPKDTKIFDEEFKFEKVFLDAKTSRTDVDEIESDISLIQKEQEIQR
jgi:hypothetical protein